MLRCKPIRCQRCQLLKRWRYQAPLSLPPKEEEAEAEPVDYRPELSIAMQAFETRHGRACVPCAKPPKVQADPDPDPDYSESDDNDDGDSSGGDPSRGAPEANMDFVTFDPMFKDRPWRCAVPDCGKGFKTGAQIKQHGQEKHDIGVVWWPCDYCDVAVKRKTHLISHMAMCHNIYERLWPCNFPGCSFQGKLRTTSPTTSGRRTALCLPAGQSGARGAAPRCASGAGRGRAARGSGGGVRRLRKRLFVLHFFSIANELSNLFEQAVRRGAEIAEAAVVHELVERAIDLAQAHELAKRVVDIAEELHDLNDVILGSASTPW